MNTLIIAHPHSDMNAIKQLITLLKPQASNIHALVICLTDHHLAHQLATIAPISEVYLASQPEIKQLTPEWTCDILLSLLDDYQRIAMVSDAFGKQTIARLGGKSRIAPITEAIEIIDEITFKRPIYAGDAIETIQLNHHNTQLLTCRVATIQENTSAQTETTIKPLSHPVYSHSHILSESSSSSERPDLISADRVVSGGRGMGSKEGYESIIPLADALNAALGASRAAVDLEYAPNDHQVGQTGKIIAPKYYIALGISGAVQHLAGMKDSQCIIAINTDPDAPIFQYADVGLIADVHDIIPQWIKQIKR